MRHTGKVELPESAGLGIELNEEIIRKYAVGGHAGAKEYCVIFSAPATRNHRSLTDPSNNC